MPERCNWRFASRSRFRNNIDSGGAVASAARYHFSMKFAVALCLCGSLAWAADKPAQLIFEQATRALAAGDFASAENGFKTVVRQEPNNVGAIANLGIIYARTNRSDQAITAYQRALRISPDDEPILLNLGIAYFKRDSHALALPYFERVLAIDPQHQQALQLRAVCRLYTGQVDSAIHDLESLWADHPHDEQLLFLLGFAHLKKGDSALSKAIFDQMFEVAGPARAQFLIGRACYEAALFPQAEESLLDVRQLAPNFAGLHLALGKLYISERRTDDAVRELKLALKDNANDEDANYFLGSLLVQESRYLEGVPFLDRAKELRPDSWAVYLYLGKAKVHSARAAEGVALLQRAVELNPDEASAQYQLGRALEASGQKVAAARAFRKARELRADALNDAKIPGVR